MKTSGRKTKMVYRFFDNTGAEFLATNDADVVSFLIGLGWRWFASTPIR